MTLQEYVKLIFGIYICVAGQAMSKIKVVYLAKSMSNDPKFDPVSYFIDSDR